MARTEIGEVREEFKKGQKGSSAMPHKRNPIKTENICGLARVLRGYVTPALENQLTWHERDLANSSAERVLLADASILLDFMLARLASTIRGLVVFPDRMRENINLTRGAVFSERVMLALSEKGMGREDAHDLVQKLVLRALDEKRDFKELLLAEEGLKLTPQEIEECFNLDWWLRNIPQIFARMGVELQSETK